MAEIEKAIVEDIETPQTEEVDVEVEAERKICLMMFYKEYQTDY